MKTLVLLSVLFSAPAFALNVGEVIPLSPSQIQCVDRKDLPPPKCTYCYGDEFFGRRGAIVTVTATLGGISKLTGNAISCQDLQNRIEGQDPVALEIFSISDRKISETFVQRSIEAKLGGINMYGSGKR